MLSVGPIEGNVATFRTKLEQAVSKWDGPAKLAVLYLPFSSDHEKFLDVASRVLHAPVVGATTGGVAFTERGHSNTGAVCAVFGGEDFEADCALAINVRSNPLFHIGHALRSMDLKSGRHTSVLVLADAFACDGEVLVSAIRDNVPPHCKFFGGTAGDDWGFKGSKVFIDGKAMSNAAVFVALHPQQRMNVDVLHGWTMAEGSRDFTITSIDGNILRRLDERPAVDVYREELRRLGLLSDAESLIAVLAKYELGARTPFGEQLKIRAPLSVGADGSITLASSLRQGEVVRVVTTTSERLIDAARNLSSRVLGPTPRASGSLVFDCAARLQLLGERYGDQVRAFHSGGGHPMVGMACYGEIAKFGGSIEGFHNTTAVMVGW
jgi:hypothetical protein